MACHGIMKLMTDPQQVYGEVGRRIKRTREKRGLTQEALASLIPLTRTSITNIEKGRQRIMVHTLLDLAAALRVSPSALLPSAPRKDSGEPLEELLQQRPRKERDWIRAVLGSEKKEE